MNEMLEKIQFSFACDKYKYYWWAFAALGFHVMAATEMKDRSSNLAIKELYKLI